MDEPDAPIETSLDQILAYIRSHWEKVSEKNRAEAEDYLECKVRTSTPCEEVNKGVGLPQNMYDGILRPQEAQCVSSRRSPEEEQMEALKAECHDARCKIQSLQAETESIRTLVRQRLRQPIPDQLIPDQSKPDRSIPDLRSASSLVLFPQKRGLENSMGDARHWHNVELQNLGSVVAKLEAELAEVHSEIEQQRHGYDTLLSNKQRLEQEIGLYHGILDGEESRLQTSEAP